jgi:hypothetical protein
VLNWRSVCEENVLIWVVVEFEEFLPKQMQVHIDPSDRQLIFALIVDWLSYFAAATHPETLNLIYESPNILNFTLQLDFLSVHLSL